MNTSEVFVGIDVSKATLSVGMLPPQPFGTIPNEEAACRGLGGTPQGVFTDLDRARSHRWP